MKRNKIAISKNLLPYFLNNSTCTLNSAHSQLVSTSASWTNGIVYACPQIESTPHLLSVVMYNSQILNNAWLHLQALK